MFNNISLSILLSLVIFSTLVSADSKILSKKNIFTADDFYNTFVTEEEKPDFNNGLSRGMNINGIPRKINKNGLSRSMNIKMTRTQHQKIMVKESVTKSEGSSCMAGNGSIAVNIQFTPNSSKVKEEDIQKLKKIAHVMNREKLLDCYFLIEGHTDAEGNDYYNLWLSQQRANSVINHLSQYNVKIKRLLALGKGEYELINTQNPNAAENRRVQFKVINHSE